MATAQVALPNGTVYPYSVSGPGAIGVDVVREFVDACDTAGLGHGLYAVVSNTMPLQLFGSRQYGSFMGWLLVPQNITNASAPLVIASLMSHFPPGVALAVAGVGACCGFLAVSLLVRHCRASEAERATPTG